MSEMKNPQEWLAQGGLPLPPRKAQGDSDARGKLDPGRDD